MKFGLGQIFEKTPKKMVLLGHTLLAVSAVAQSKSQLLSTISPNICGYIAIASLIGTFLTSMFGERRKNN